MSTKWANTQEETAAFEAEVKDIEAWWQTDRQKHIQRSAPSPQPILHETLA